MGERARARVTVRVGVRVRVAGLQVQLGDLSLLPGTFDQVVAVANDGRVRGERSIAGE